MSLNFVENEESSKVSEQENEERCLKKCRLKKSVLNSFLSLTCTRVKKTYNDGSKKDERNMAELRLIGSNMKLDKEKSKVTSNWITGIANTIN